VGISFTYYNKSALQFLGQHRTFKSRALRSVRDGKWLISRNTPVAYWGGGVGVSKPPPKFQSFDKAQPNSQFRGKYIRNNLIRIRVSLICKFSGTPDCSQIPVLSAVCLQLNLMNPPAQKKIPGYATGTHEAVTALWCYQHSCFIQHFKHHSTSFTLTSCLFANNKYLTNFPPKNTFQYLKLITLYLTVILEVQMVVTFIICSVS
jgi:hypothetical protein